MNAFDELQRQIAGFGHRQYPFLDARYSTGACAPVIDFTLWLRDRIAAGDAQSGIALLQQITDRPEVTATLINMMKLFDLSSYLAAEETLINELMATYILAYRTRSYMSGHGHLSLLAMLIELVLSLYPFQLRPGKLPELERKLRDAQRKAEILQLPPVGPTAYSPGLSGDVLHKLRQLPPTCRSVLYDATRHVESPVEPVRLRLSAYYEFRMYGCNEDWNAQYIASLGWGSPIPPDTDISRYVGKPDIQTALDAFSLPYKKTAKKSDLLQLARTHPACWTSLCDKFSREVILFQPSILTELQRWCQSVSNLRWAVYALAAI
jgi:hypothetical protein